MQFWLTVFLFIPLLRDHSREGQKVGGVSDNQPVLHLPLLLSKRL